MSKVSEHLRLMHEAAAEHNDALEKSHRALAMLVKSSGFDGSKKIAVEHEKIADLHKAHAEHHRELMAECEKAISGTDLEKRAAFDREAIPAAAGLAAVYPDGVRPVPRAGQQAIAGPTVDPEFEKLIKLDD